MSHDNDHCGHGHHHGHHHGKEERAHSDSKPLTEHDKLLRMLEHWLRHNEEHATSYEMWSGRAKSLGEEEVQALLMEMANEARRQNEKLRGLLDKSRK